MPIEFLTDEQAGKYGQFAGAPSRAQLERFFFLNNADRALIEQRRRDHNRLGFGVQLGTVRFLGTFLADPLDVPEEVIGYVADQLKIDDLSNVNAYGEREKTAYEHAWEIRRAYGYREFVEAEADLKSINPFARACWIAMKRSCISRRVRSRETWRSGRNRPIGTPGAPGTGTCSS